MTFFRISDQFLENDQISGFLCFFTIFRVFRFIIAIIFFQILFKSQGAHFPMRTIQFYDFSSLKLFFCFFLQKKQKFQIKPVTSFKSKFWPTFFFQILFKSQGAHFPMRTLRFYDFASLKLFLTFFRFSDQFLENDQISGFLCFFTIFRVFVL